MALAVLDRAARHAHWLLVAGLLIGIASPTLAKMAKPWIAEMIAAMLFLAALRVGPKRLIGAKADFSRSLGVALILQLALPVALYFMLSASGVSGPLLLGLMLMSAAAPISGSPNLAIIMGGDPAPSLRLLSVATAILPLTAIPVFWLSPALGTPGEIFAAAARLLAVIAVAVTAAFAVRAKFLPDPDQYQTRMIDGLSAILMAAVVVGLMSAVGEALFEDPRALAFNMAVAFAANLLLQIAALIVARRFFNGADAVAFAIAAGNRNIALFLTALPAAVTDPLLLFIGCFQVPMYLTPMMMGLIYRRVTARHTS